MTVCYAHATVTATGTRPQEFMVATTRAEIRCDMEVEALLGPHIACVSDCAETGSLRPEVGRSDLV